MTIELEQKWRAEFEADWGAITENRHEWRAYLAACRARHAEAEELRAENARLRESH